MEAQSCVLYNCGKPYCPSSGTSNMKTRKKNYTNNKAKILKPNFIEGQKDTCKNFQFSTDQDGIYTVIFPVELLCLVKNKRIILYWLFPGLAIPKPEFFFNLVKDSLNLACSATMVGVKQQHPCRLSENDA